VELRKLTYSNVDEVLALTVREEQKEFVASNEYSLVDAYIALSNGGCAQPFGIYEGEEPVGFVMFGYGTLDDSDEPQIAAGNYCLWRFMIEQKHQGRGLGKKALQACLDYLQTRPLGPAEYCWLSYEPENEAAKSLYKKFGFAENGQMCGEEIVAVRKL
jgi:diamine N-acetyltransferase